MDGGNVPWDAGRYNALLVIMVARSFSGLKGLRHHLVSRHAQPLLRDVAMTVTATVDYMSCRQPSKFCTSDHDLLIDPLLARAKEKSEWVLPGTPRSKRVNPLTDVGVAKLRKTLRMVVGLLVAAGVWASGWGLHCLVDPATLDRLGEILGARETSGGMLKPISLALQRVHAHSKGKFNPKV